MEEDVAAEEMNAAADSTGFPPVLLSFQPDGDLH